MQAAEEDGEYMSTFVGHHHGKPEELFMELAQGIVSFFVALFDQLLLRSLLSSQELHDHLVKE